MPVHRFLPSRLAFLTAVMFALATVVSGASQGPSSPEIHCTRQTLEASQ